MAKVTAVIGRPTICGSADSAAVTLAHSPARGNGPTTTRGTRRSAGGPAASSPHTSSSPPPSCASCIDRRVGASAASLLTITMSARSSSDSLGSTKGSSRVRISSGRPSKPKVNARSPPAACDVVHFHGVGATASRGKSSSNQTRSSIRSTIVVSSFRSRIFKVPEVAPPITSATKSTVDPCGTSIRTASSETGRGVSIRMYSGSRTTLDTVSITGRLRMWMAWVVVHVEPPSRRYVASASSPSSAALNSPGASIRIGSRRERPSADEITRSTPSTLPRVTFPLISKPSPWRTSISPGEANCNHVAGGISAVG